MIQVNNPSNPTQLSELDRIHNILKVFKAIVPVAVITIIFYLFLAIQTGDNRLIGAAGSTLVYLIIAFVSFRLARRKPILAAQLLVFGWAVAVISFILFISGLGLTFAVATMLITSLIAGLTLPQKQVRQSIIINLGLSIIIILLDMYLPIARLTTPVLRIYVPVVLGLLALVYVFFIVRQFYSYSLQTKLVLAFLVVTMLSVGVIIFYMSWSISTITRDNVGSRLNSIAETQAVAVGDLLVRQLDRLEALSLNKTFQDEIDRLNALYEGDPLTIRNRLALIDQQWQAALGNNSLIQSRLNNDLAVELDEFRDHFPGHSELFVTDKYGALVAATGRTTDFYQADEAWWQAAFNDGQGATYIGQPAFDQSVRKYAFIMAVPLRSHVTGDVIGVVRTTYRLGELRRFLDSPQLKQTGYADLYLPGEKIFSASNVGPTEADPIYLAQIQEMADQDYILFDYKGGHSLVSQAPIRTITGEKAVADLKWSLVIHQLEETALAPVNEQVQDALILALFIMVGAATAALVVAYLLAGPITRLTGVAAQVAAGNLQAQARVESGDEIGTLATIFNTMTKQLREFIDDLEARVSARTRQLETVGQIGQRLAGILDLSDLLREVINRTKETFNYYHAHIYLLDEKGEVLTLAQGYGEAGAEMKAKGHSIPLDAPRSLVARAAREGRINTIENVHVEPGWLPNPLLPETRSEMAVPIILGTQVVGVLDVQSEKVGGLTKEDETILQALANQVAVAVRNARLFTETQDALYEAQRLQQLYTGQAWDKLSVIHSTDYEYRQPSLPPLKQVPTPEAVAALKQKQTIDLRQPASSTNGQVNQPDRSVEIHTPAALATPLRLRDQIIGVLGIHSDDSTRQWSAEEIALIEAVSEQMSLAIENARLFEESQRNAWRDQVISESTAKVWSSAELEEVMRAAVAQLGEKLHASEVVIRLGTEEQLVQE